MPRGPNRPEMSMDRNCAYLTLISFGVRPRSAHARGFLRSESIQDDARASRNMYDMAITALMGLMATSAKEIVPDCLISNLERGKHTRLDRVFEKRPPFEACSAEVFLFPSDISYQTKASILAMAGLMSYGQWTTSHKDVDIILTKARSMSELSAFALPENVDALFIEALKEIEYSNKKPLATAEASISDLTSSEERGRSRVRSKSEGRKRSRSNRDMDDIEATNRGWQSSSPSSASQSSSKRRRMSEPNFAFSLTQTDSSSQNNFATNLYALFGGECTLDKIEAALSFCSGDSGRAEQMLRNEMQEFKNRCTKIKQDVLVKYPMLESDIVLAIASEYDGNYEKAMKEIESRVRMMREDQRAVVGLNSTKKRKSQPLETDEKKEPAEENIREVKFLQYGMKSIEQASDVGRACISTELPFAAQLTSIFSTEETLIFVEEFGESVRLQIREQVHLNAELQNLAATESNGCISLDKRGRVYINGALDPSQELDEISSGRVIFIKQTFDGRAIEVRVGQKIVSFLRGTSHDEWDFNNPTVFAVGVQSSSFNPKHTRIRCLSRTLWNMWMREGVRLANMTKFSHAATWSILEMSSFVRGRADAMALDLCKREVFHVAASLSGAMSTIDCADNSEKVISPLEVITKFTLIDHDRIHISSGIVVQGGEYYFEGINGVARVESLQKSDGSEEEVMYATVNQVVKVRYDRDTWRSILNQHTLGTSATSHWGKRRERAETLCIVSAFSELATAIDSLRGKLIEAKDAFERRGDRTKNDLAELKDLMLNLEQQTISSMKTVVADFKDLVVATPGLEGNAQDVYYSSIILSFLFNQIHPQKGLVTVVSQMRGDFGVTMAVRVQISDTVKCLGTVPLAEGSRKHISSFTFPACIMPENPNSIRVRGIQLSLSIPINSEVQTKNIDLGSQLECCLRGGQDISRQGLVIDLTGTVDAMGVMSIRQAQHPVDLDPVSPDERIRDTALWTQMEGRNRHEKASMYLEASAFASAELSIMSAQERTAFLVQRPAQPIRLG